MSGLFTGYEKELLIARLAGESIPESRAEEGDLAVTKLMGFLDSADNALEQIEAKKNLERELVAECEELKDQRGLAWHERDEAEAKLRQAIEQRDELLKAIGPFALSAERLRDQGRLEPRPPFHDLDLMFPDVSDLSAADFTRALSVSRRIQEEG